MQFHMQWFIIKSISDYPQLSVVFTNMQKLELPGNMNPIGVRMMISYSEIITQFFTVL